MQLSAEGVSHIKRWEGLRTEVYLDPGGLPSIGIGHLLTKDELSSGKIHIDHRWVRYHHGLTLAQVEALFRQDLVPYVQAVDAWVTVSVSQDQFDVLVSFAFNVGRCALKRSTLLHLLNAGEHEKVPRQLRRWVFAGGRPVYGLVLRRAREAEIWTEGHGTNGDGTR